jgi:hypothetical protein
MARLDPEARVAIRTLVSRGTSNSVIARLLDVTEGAVTLPRCMCGRPLECKGLLLDLAYGRVRSCVRPLTRPTTAGPDGVRRTSPKHGCGMEVPLQQAGFPVRRFDRLPSLAFCPLLRGDDEGQAACGVRR